MARSPNTTTAPTGQIPPFGLRMLPELREKVEEAARQSGRSMNAEIVDRLERSFIEGPDFAMVLADAQYEAAVQAVERESVRIQFTSLASLVETIAQRAKDALATSLTESELKLLKEALVYAEDERTKLASFEDALDRVAAARKRVEEARYRFLEAKGAKGVRQAKV